MAWTASLGVSAAVTTSLRRVGLRPLPVPLWWAVSSPGDTVCGSLRMFQQRSHQNRPSCWPATATTAASGACERTTRPPPGGPEAVASTVGAGRGHRRCWRCVPVGFTGAGSGCRETRVLPSAVGAPRGWDPGFATAAVSRGLGSRLGNLRSPGSRGPSQGSGVTAQLGSVRGRAAGPAWRRAGRGSRSRGLRPPTGPGNIVSISGGPAGRPTQTAPASSRPSGPNRRMMAESEGGRPHKSEGRAFFSFGVPSRPLPPSHRTMP